MIGEFRSIGSHLVGLVAVALRSFFGTLVIVFLAGVLLAGGSYFFLLDQPLYGLIAAIVALIESLLTGIIIGGKRAVVMALAHGIRSSGLGSRVVRAIFDKLLGVPTDQERGERGGWVGQRLETLPLAEADRGLGQAVRHLVHADRPCQHGPGRPARARRLPLQDRQ